MSDLSWIDRADQQVAEYRRLMKVSAEDEARRESAQRAMADIRAALAEIRYPLEELDSPLRSRSVDALDEWREFGIRQFWWAGEMLRRMRARVSQASAPKPSRAEQIERAGKVLETIRHLRRAAELVPDAEQCVRRPIQRFAAELIEIDAPLDTCETCWLEWDGCQEPPRDGPECNHADMWGMYGEAKDAGLIRLPGEPLLAYLDRFYLSTEGRFWGCTKRVAERDHDCR
ncbi:hypothetical protein [Sorangium cellulosum]|uniref:Uncharacterized protein n=1 Tax=Sorangium cellulosum So0157-2 TaxID=1254432 RepID=S4XQS7_SORCE|nr:hypothetical protein [Sorangium cellulosum]AGP34210.1 hypothetical protein SCE1572_06685 [Sorangium cellulosum So0157-2]